MTTFETVDKRSLEYGNNNFLDVAYKVAKDQSGSTPFMAVTRGYMDNQGSRRYKTNLTMPPEPRIVDFVATSLMEVRPADEDATD